MRPTRPRPPDARGFTLVEVLVAMTLLSLVMVALGASLRTMASTETRVDERLARSDDLRASHRFLRAALGRASVRKAERVAAGAQPSILFAGSERELAWLGVMPARFGAGGRSFFRLAVESLPEGPALVLRFVPWRGEAAWPVWAQAEARVIAPEVEGFALEYAQDGAGGAVQWARNWSDPQRLPSRVRLRVRQEGTDWPDLVIAMRPLAAGDRSRGGFVLGAE